MEIISYVLDGAQEHKDSMGTGSVIRYGSVQRMSAGSGVRHSEFNHSDSEPVHFLQIWITPHVQGTAPGYEEKHFDPAGKKGQWRLIASSDSRGGSVFIHQDASVYASLLDGGDTLEYTWPTDRCGYLHVARSTVAVNGVALKAGEALKMVKEPRIVVADASAAEILLFDLPMQH